MAYKKIIIFKSPSGRKRRNSRRYSRRKRRY